MHNLSYALMHPIDFWIASSIEINPTITTQSLFVGGPTTILKGGNHGYD